MSAMPRNKKVAALLTGASLLTLVGVSRASAAQIITGANNTVIITANTTNVVVGPAAVISGDVINQATISSNQVGVTISPGAVITGAFVNTSNALIRGHDTGPGIRAAAGILDLAAGAPRN